MSLKLELELCNYLFNVLNKLAALLMNKNKLCFLR